MREGERDTKKASRRSLISPSRRSVTFYGISVRRLRHSWCLRRFEREVHSRELNSCPA